MKVFLKASAKSIRSLQKKHFRGILKKPFELFCKRPFDAPFKACCRSSMEALSSHFRIPIEVNLKPPEETLTGSFGSLTLYSFDLFLDSLFLEFALEVFYESPFEVIFEVLSFRVIQWKTFKLICERPFMISLDAY